MGSFEFNALLLDISNQLSGEQLESLKFLCKDVVGKREMEKITTGNRLFQLLTERGELSADKTERLSKLLREIRREDLSDKLNGFQHEDLSDQPDKAERDKLDIATDLIAESLGKQWRKFGRKLCLSEVKLDSISQRHPSDLEETARELLKEWRKIRAAEAQTKELIRALRGCQLNLTADKVEDELANPGT